MLLTPKAGEVSVTVIATGFPAGSFVENQDMKIEPKTVGAAVRQVQRERNLEQAAPVRSPLPSSSSSSSSSSAAAAAAVAAPAARERPPVSTAKPVPQPSSDEGDDVPNFLSRLRRRK